MKSAQAHTVKKNYPSLVVERGRILAIILFFRTQPRGEVAEDYSSDQGQMSVQCRCPAPLSKENDCFLHDAVVLRFLDFST